MKDKVYRKKFEALDEEFSVTSGITNAEIVRNEFQQWAEFVKTLGFTDIVSPEDNFKTELSSRTEWTNSSSCGVYAWVTENHQAYVGQAVNVRNRLRQHWKNYRDIAYASFQAVPRANLDETEKMLIKKMELQFPKTTLNVKFATSSAKLVPFDQVVTAKAAEEYLRGQHLSKSQSWQEWPLLELKQQRKFDKFKEKSFFLRATSALQTFIEICIPDAPATEVKFWSTTLLYTSSLLLRVNVGQQEVLTLHIYEKEVVVTIFANSQLDDSGEKSRYQTQSFAHTVYADDLKKWLTKKRTVECRKLVIWLMRHTTPMNSGSHCPQLIRAAFAN